MGMIGRILGTPAATGAVGRVVKDVAEVFLPNATRKMEAAHEAYMAAIDEHGVEFQYVRPGVFERLVNGLNRLPRPMLAFGTLGLFVYAMVDPVGFSGRMVGLNYVPEPLWWLLAAIVGFYFGAREAHYFRARPVGPGGNAGGAPAPGDASAGAAPAPEDNPALREWRGHDER
ncbi:holin family protein [Albidovulum sp.]|uniref:holin family protein n=1 Tax=Albidovulum sp. TaxID=1872424 RepID=UPI003528A445